MCAHRRTTKEKPDFKSRSCSSARTSSLYPAPHLASAPRDSTRLPLYPRRQRSYPRNRIAAWAYPRALNSALMIALRAITIAVPDGSVSRAFFIWPKHGGIIASVGNRNRPCHAVSLGHRSW